MAKQNEILRKITIGKCGLDSATVLEAVNAGEGKAALLRVAGLTSSAKAGQTDKGEYLELKGQFTAVNLLTGEAFDGSACILPNFISDSLGHALTQSESVEFALEIGAKENAKSVTKYEFTVRPLVEAAKSDKMAALLKAADFDNIPKLEAPAPKKPAKGAK